MLTYSSPFPSTFVFGVAAASAQIEGAAFEDGKGESIWDRFCRVPGAIHDGNTPTSPATTTTASTRTSH